MECEVTTYDKKEVITRSMDYKQALEINPRKFDYFFSESLGKWEFRQPDGQWIDNSDDWTGLGRSGVRIIQALWCNIRIFIPPSRIAYLTGYPSLKRPNVLSAQLRRLRIIHGDGYPRSHFFESRRVPKFGVRWHPDRTFLWIEAIQ